MIIGSSLLAVSLMGGAQLSTAGVQATAAEATGPAAIDQGTEAGEPDAAQTPAEQSDDEIVVTGTRFLGNAGEASLKMDVPVRDVPLSVTSYTKEFLQALVTTRVEDLYGYMPGVTRSGGTGLSLNLRGFNTGNADRGTILVDGLPGLTSTFGSAATVSVESIELVKGATSVLFGKAQPGGFLNVVMKKPQSNPFTMLRAQGESFIGDFANKHLAYTLAFDNTGPLTDGINYRIIGEHGGGDAWRDFDFSENWYIVPSVEFKLSSKAKLLLRYEYRHDRSHHDEFLVAPLNDTSLVADFDTSYQEPEDRRTETGHALTARLEVDLPGAITWRTGFRGVRIKNRAVGFEQRAVVAVIPSARFPSGFRVDRSDRDFQNHRNFYFGDSNFSKELRIGGTEHRLLAGFSIGREESEFDRVQNLATGTAFSVDLRDPSYGLPGGAPTPGFHRLAISKNVSAYLMDHMTLTPHLKAVAAIRYDRETQTVEELRLADPDRKTVVDAYVPMVGLLVQPSDRVSFYASYSQSFNPPSPADLDAAGNPLVKPQVGTQYEAGVKVNFYRNRLRGTVALYNIKLTDSVANLGGGVSAQIGGLRSRGFEIEVNAAPLKGWELQAGYSRNDAEVTDDPVAFVVGQELFNSPKHNAAMFSRYDIQNGPVAGLGFSLGVAHLSERFSTFAANAAARRVRMPGYTRVDAGLYYKFADWELAMRVRNLFDKKYIEGATGANRIVPGDPRSVQVALFRTF